MNCDHDFNKEELVSKGWTYYPCPKCGKDVRLIPDIPWISKKFGPFMVHREDRGTKYPWLGQSMKDIKAGTVIFTTFKKAPPAIRWATRISFGRLIYIKQYGILFSTHNRRKST